MWENTYVVDIETNGLKATKIHCLCYRKIGTDNVVALTDYEEIKKFLSTPHLKIIGHYFVQYDRVQLEKILKTKFNFSVIDTLGLSWTLYPERKSHGLEEYGVEYGVEKPPITDWENLSVEEYVHRCTEDVKINYKVWLDELEYLLELYDYNLNSMMSYIRYIEFKMTVVSEQEQEGVRFDEQKALDNLKFLEMEKDKKILALKAVMPKVKKKAFKSPPANIYKKDGSLSSHGLKWMDFLDAHNLPHDHVEPVEYIKSIEEPNPNSAIQKKDWLYSLGWIPEHYSFDKDKDTGEIKKVAQIKNKDLEKQGEVCESVKILFLKEPSLEILEGLTIISHRISIFKGFIRDAENGRLHGGMSGFTNTMRLKHVTIVNLPKVEKLYGEEVRGCLIANEGEILCGSDLKNVESMTRNHYIFPYDPSYVADMTAPGFDSHWDIAKLAEFVTEQQIQDHKNKIADYKVERSKGKTVNFAAVYGVGAPTLSRNSGLPIELCRKLLKVYWERNWSVRQVADSCYVKEIRGQKWLYNPVSKFYYTLRYEKDRFSTLNQGTAVYVFDLYMLYLREQGILAVLQMHDELLFNLKESEKEIVEEKIKIAMKKVNEALKLNVTIESSADYGFRYSDCH